MRVGDDGEGNTGLTDEAGGGIKIKFKIFDKEKEFLCSRLPTLPAPPLLFQDLSPKLALPKSNHQSPLVCQTRWDLHARNESLCPIFPT